MSFESLLHTANVFEAYILWRIRAEEKPGVIRATLYETQAEQLAHGDIALGDGQNIEIKFDRKYHKTGNLYVEVAEKHSADQAQWVASGIRCTSDAEWWVMGDYRDFFSFHRSALQAEQDSGLYPIITIPCGTSRGFLLRPKRIAACAVRWAHWSEIVDPISPMKAESMA